MYSESCRRDLIRLGVAFDKFLSKVYPYIDLMAISGSLSNPFYKNHNDIDFFIVCKRGHLWDCLITVFFTSRLYSLVTGVPSRLFCFNYLIDSSYVFEELKFDGISSLEFLNLIVLRGYREYARLLFRFRRPLMNFHRKRFLERYRKSLKHLKRMERNSPMSKFVGFFFVIMAKFLSPLFKYLIRKREEFWKAYLKRLGYRYDKIYSNKYVYRRHKK